MRSWMMSGLWGMVAGSALVIGAAVGYLGKVPARWIAAVMAFGGGGPHLGAVVRSDGRGVPARWVRGDRDWLPGRRSGVHRRQLRDLAEGGQAPQAVRRSATVGAGPRRQRHGDRDRCVARRDPRVDRDRRQYAGRRRGQHGRRDRDLPVEHSRGAVELGRHAQRRAQRPLRVRRVVDDRGRVRRRGAARKPGVRPVLRGRRRGHDRGRRECDPRDARGYDDAGGISGRAGSVGAGHGARLPRGLRDHEARRLDNGATSGGAGRGARGAAAASRI
jgi:hypothetical protein